MKFLILILVLAISAQPLQAGVCDMDMEQSQETTHPMDMSGSDGHDCCDSCRQTARTSTPACNDVLMRRQS